jgi:hypothetical protein
MSPVSIRGTERTGAYSMSPRLKNAGGLVLALPERCTQADATHK